MPDIGIVPVLVATVVVFLLGAAYYAVVSSTLEGVSASDDRSPGAAVLVVELLRGLVTVGVVAILAERTGSEGWPAGLALGLLLWCGFPLVLWVGAMIHERTPLRLAAIHGGDWLLKLVVTAVIVSVWG